MEKGTDRNLSPFKNDLGEPIANSSHAKIFRYGEIESGKSFIIKEGETNYTPPLLKCLQKFVALNRETVSGFLVKYLGPEFNIQPDFDFVKNGVAEYFLMRKYFHCDASGRNGDSESRRKLLAELADKRGTLHEQMRKILGDEDTVEILTSIVRKHQDENFLPEEFGVVIGHPHNLDERQAAERQAKEEKLPETYYIIQEGIGGKNVKPLSESTDEELRKHPELLEKLVTFAVLTKKMYLDTGKLIDLRPEEVLRNPFEYFQKTANVLVDVGSNGDAENVYFVDTRWLWDKNSKIGGGGINLIQHLGIASIDRAIKKYFDLSKSAGSGKV